MDLYKRINPIDDFDTNQLDDFTQKEIEKIGEYTSKFDVEIIKGKVNSDDILYMVYNNRNVGTIMKNKDDWFYTKYITNSGVFLYKCDQLEGLMENLKMYLE